VLGLIYEAPGTYNCTYALWMKA